MERIGICCYAFVKALSFLVALCLYAFLAAVPMILNIRWMNGPEFNNAFDAGFHIFSWCWIFAAIYALRTIADQFWLGEG